MLQQRKLHVLEKEMRLTKQQLDKLVQDVENDVPLPQKAEQNADVQLDALAVQKDALAVQKNALAEQNVDVQQEKLVEQNVDVHQLNVEDDDKTLNLFSIFF